MPAKTEIDAATDRPQITRLTAWHNPSTLDSMKTEQDPLPSPKLVLDEPGSHTSDSHSSEWHLWQLLDSALPTGGFAHSTGLEAAWQHGLIGDGDSLSIYLRDLIRQTAVGSTPIAIAVRRSPEAFAEWDAFFGTTLSNHVANRASRAQGRALLSTMAATFPSPLLSRVDAMIRAKPDATACHLPAAFGLTCSALGLADPLTASGYLFLTVRAAISSAVRLGAVGPLEGQRIQAGLSGDVRASVIVALETAPGVIYQTNFMADLLQGTQDRLYSRLFQS